MEPDGAPRRGTWGRAVWSGLLSLVFPGLGQVHAQAWRPGAMLLAVAVAADIVALRVLASDPTPLMVGILVAMFAGVVLLHLVATIDAVLRTRRAGGARWRPWYRSTWFAAVVFVATSISAAQLMPRGWRSFLVPSGSMVPTLLVGDYVMADVRPGAAMLSRGDVIVFVSPRDGKTDYVKRVVGLPGDTVQLVHGRLLVNGQQVDRRVAAAGYKEWKSDVYNEVLPGGATDTILQQTDDGPYDNTAEFHVPQDAVFVLGDNRDNSLDSRMPQVGFVRRDQIVGRVRTIYWAADRDRIGTEVR
jgi:signal peptidase I